MTTTVTTPAADDQVVLWHNLPSDEVCRTPRRRSRRRAERRRGHRAPARGTARTSSPRRRRNRRWKAFLRQYSDLMQLVLVGAAIVSIVAIQDVGTALVVLGLTVLNALMGLHQEGKAAESVAALRQMLIMTASVKRDGQTRRAARRGARARRHRRVRGRRQGAGRRARPGRRDPGDRGGRRSPARARRSSKSVDPVAGDEVALGDRIDMAYMNSQVTRGRGEMVVTATGMSSEVGHISGMLSGVEQEKTPLTKQLDQLTVVITIMAAAALVLIIILGLVRGEDFDTLFLIGISLAISAIPTGLPAVVTMLLSMGTQRAGRKGRDRQAAQVGRDARVDVGDLLGQDRHADAQPDDGAPAGASSGAGSTSTARATRPTGASSTPPASGDDPARAVPPADGARQRRRDPRRRVHRRPDRGSAGRARRQGRARRRSRRAAPIPVSPRCRSTPSTS